MAFQPGRLVAALSTLLCWPGVLSASLPLAIDERDRVVLHGNIHPLVNRAMPTGRPEATVPMDRMILSLRLDPQAQTRLATLLAQQQDPASPNYHKWLTPEAFGEQFGPSQADLDSIEGWLQDHEFQVEGVTPGRTAILFSGNVQQVEQAFNTLILEFEADGRAFHANAVEPTLPRALASVVHGIVSLHNLPRQAMSHRSPSAPPPQQALLTGGNGAHYLAPGDFATLYNLKPLYAAGIDGTGVSIAVVGRTHIGPTDIATFRSQSGLSVNAPLFILNGRDPGDLGAGEDTEAYLDVEWAGAVARNATVKFVMSASTGSTDGVDLSSQYIVSNNLAPVMTVSFGQCEGAMGASENNFYNNLWAQAAAQGITVLVASGDSGAAGCSAGSASAGSGQAVSGMASTPSNVCVGGTLLNEGGGSYWSTANGAGLTSVLGYIPEKAWNESAAVSGGSGLWATGGGASGLYGKPAWQVAPGVPADGRRDVPDVSLSAGSHDAYLVQAQGSLQAVGGTSCAAPAFAGVVALVVQATGQRQGNINPVLYKLGNAQFKGTGATVFHDVLTGSNTVPGASGFLSGPGYDQATGLGSVDAQALVQHWTEGLPNTVTASITVPSSNPTVASGAAVSFTGTAKDSVAAATLAYAWTFGDGATATGASASHAYTNTGTASSAYTVTLKVTDNAGVFSTATRTVTVSPAPRNTLTASITAPAANVTVASGAAAAFTATAKDSSATATLAYAWDFGDGTTATGASASHAYANKGTANTVFTATLTVTDNTGISATATRTVTVTPAPRNTLTASITAPAANVTVASGAATSFTATAKDSSATAALAYAWTFGDGAATAGASATHAYTNTGTANAAFTATVTVTDSTGVTATATRTITVTPAPRNTLTASITAPAANVTLASGATAAFTATAKDSSSVATLTYAWNFGDGATGTGATTSHLYANTGTTNAAYTATLTVTDNTGVSTTATRTVTVTPAPRNTLTASITSPAANVTLASGSTASFAATAKDSSATATLGYAWNFGDGATGSGASASHLYANTGTTNAVYTATLTVTDNTGVTATATRTVTVTPRNILSAAIATPSASLVTASGTAVAFNATAKDSSATATLAYAWNFGDGTTASGASATHTFQATGVNAVYTVTVTLTVTDNTGVAATATRTVTVTPPPAALVAAISTPSADFTVASGAVFTLTAVATDTNPSPVLSYGWSTSIATTLVKRPVVLAVPSTLSSSVSASVTNASTQPIAILFTFTVTDNKGGKATATRKVTVNPVGR
jgi:PKD repeat protein